MEGQAGGSLHGLLFGDTLQSDSMECLSVHHVYLVDVLNSRYLKLLTISYLLVKFTCLSPTVEEQLAFFQKMFQQSKSLFFFGQIIHQLDEVGPVDNRPSTD